MRLTVACFNLNNLFSRYNLFAEADEAPPDAPAQKVIRVEEQRVITVEGSYTLREYRGTLVKKKPERRTRQVAERILAIAPDVLAVQEVEDLPTLRSFNREWLGSRYRNCVLVEGNDERLIDVALMSTAAFPIGAITSWKQAVHPDEPGEPIFSRDLLQVEILDAERAPLLSVFNTHLKSHYVDWRSTDPEQDRLDANARRRRQATTAADIVRRAGGERFLVCGDLNDPPGSPDLAPLRAADLGLIDPLEGWGEPFPKDPQAPLTAWTHRFKDSGKPAEYEQLDQILVSPGLAGAVDDARVDRRKDTLSGDGSDHDPVVVVFEL